MPLLIPKIFRDSECRQPDPPACAGRLIHLAINQDTSIEHAGSLHFGEKLMAFAGALANPREDGNALVAFDHCVDELHHYDSLADTCTAEHGSFASLCQRGEKVDHLDAGFEYRGGWSSLFQRWGRSVDGPTRHIGR